MASETSTSLPQSAIFCIPECPRKLNCWYEISGACWNLQADMQKDGTISFELEQPQASLLCQDHAGSCTHELLVNVGHDSHASLYRRRGSILYHII